MSPHPTGDHLTNQLRSLLTLPALTSWVESTPQGIGFAWDATGCLIAEYIRSSLGVAAHGATIVVDGATAQVTYRCGESAKVDLPEPFRRIVARIDNGATETITRARALDTLYWLRGLGDQPPPPDGDLGSAYLAALQHQAVAIEASPLAGDPEPTCEGITPPEYEFADVTEGAMADA